MTMLNNIPDERPDTPLLDSVDYPHQLRILRPEQLRQLATELRQFLIYSVGQSGGHLAAGLGVVELSVALHYVFNTPEDKLVWDVGHQTYPHKILTGRRAKMDSIRQLGGLAPFTNREESEYDVFGAGHSSTSISAALGLAEANKGQGKRQRVVAITGDGALTAGMAFEALNHAGDTKSDLLVIFNDNSMSISNNVGALSGWFSNFVAGKTYIGLKEFMKQGLDHLPPARKFMHQTEEGLKHFFLPPSMFFETLGFDYTGILDGHDLAKLISVFENVKDLRGPRLIHIKTSKGKGLLPAEEDPIGYHALAKLEPKSSKNKSQAKNKSPSPPKYTDIFSKWICQAAKQRKDLVAITPAMREGSGLVEFSKLFPGRYYDVGIAEQHALTMAAGLAVGGLRPVVAIYSTFLQRAYDQLIHDIALQNLPVIFAIDRSGLVGEDGPTHHGNYDLSYLRCIPNMQIMTPSDENELQAMLQSSLSCKGPVAIRYPRGAALGVPLSDKPEAISPGKARVLREGQSKDKAKPALLAFGSCVAPAQEVAEKHDLTLVDMRFVKPLDTQLILSLAKKHGRLVTIEENVKAGGAGSAVAELLVAENNQCDLCIIGIEDVFISHGPQGKLRQLAGLDAPSIEKAIKARWKD